MKWYYTIARELSLYCHDCYWQYLRCLLHRCFHIYHYINEFIDILIQLYQIGKLMQLSLLKG